MTHPARPVRGGRVVVGLDGSDSAWAALDQAVAEARRREATLEIVHAWPWGRADPLAFDTDTEPSRPAVEIARTVLRLAVSRAREQDPQLRIVPTLTAQDAVPELLRIGEDASLIVIGTRGLGGFTGLLLGSVSLRLAAHTRRPLLVVRGGPPAAYGPEGHGKVLVGVESGADAPAARFAFEEARRRRARLRVLYAWPRPRVFAGDHALPAREMVALRAEREQTVAYAMVAKLREEFGQIRVREHTTHSAPAQALMEASRAADILVLAVHRRTPRLGIQLGAVTHAALHHAHCPVVLVPVE
ncbi:universal stress protein [Streptomyces sp. SID8361]|nr:MULTISPECIES: universal stress protein [unclassified Streptomyces]AUA09611.1 Universal stress protein [Streptomyces sp. M56]MYU15823.1 universal stress protein [Streptomyces sp. SID8361]SCG10368.1 Nucleotide-binding universal stress protein, UspA family [Streptomyces sp. MnatMP-M27]